MRQLVGLALVSGLTLFGTNAHAVFHFMKIVEVFTGTPAAPNAQYVVLQMHSAGQNAVTGHGITVYNAAGTLINTFTFPAGVANGADQSKILIATAESSAFFGNLTHNLAMTPVLNPAGGMVCFDAIPFDCVAWGNFTGVSPPNPVGEPAVALNGLNVGKALLRRLDIAGSSSVLDAADDTNDCNNDFVLDTPTPQNNAGATGTIPPSTCANNTIEGLEQCDDGNFNKGDGCSAICTFELPPPDEILADGFEEPPPPLRAPR